MEPALAAGATLPVFAVLAAGAAAAGAAADVSAAEAAGAAAAGAAAAGAAAGAAAEDVSAGAAGCSATLEPLLPQAEITSATLAKVGASRTARLLVEDTIKPHFRRDRKVPARRDVVAGTRRAALPDNSGNKHRVTARRVAPLVGRPQTRLVSDDEWAQRSLRERPRNRRTATTRSRTASNVRKSCPVRSAIRSRR